jgi:ribosomal protein S20
VTGADEATRTEGLNMVYSLIDRAVLKGILHKNTASRYKSRVTKAISLKSA